MHFGLALPVENVLSDFVGKFVSGSNHGPAVPNAQNLFGRAAQIMLNKIVRKEINVAVV